ncbi:cation acetate symporter [Janibacter sp. Y6]|uniref:cation acetate symporter n=1 Tax=Janibacter sp. Y6 TaxID=2913552 RepID=UPI0034A2B175
MRLTEVATGASLPSVGAIVLVCVATLTLGVLGMRLARGTSDFYVAGRAVSPWRNASAIGGEYLSAASYLGVAGLVYTQGADMLWLPVGYTIGYLVLLVLVAAPLRRSGAYTLPDFAEVRLRSQPVRLLSAGLVVGIGWLYLLPQMQGAGLALQHVSGLPTWVGGVVVAAVITAGVVGGGMRSITLVQAFQYWIKLSAIAVPAFVLVVVWLRDGAPSPVADDHWWEPLTGPREDHRLYTTYSTLLALCLGTMGLPHIVVRFYTNPDGRAARRTTVAVLALLGLFYVFPPVYGVLGRVYLPAGGVRADEVVLGLPQAVVPGLSADVLTAMLAGGAFAAFLSTASGLALSVAGALDQDVLRRVVLRRTAGDAHPVQTFRVAAVVGVLVPLVISQLVDPVGISLAVGHAFAIAASTFAPLVILGVWWRRLTPPGAAAGILVGGVCSIGAASLNILGGGTSGWSAPLLEAPAAWSAPLAVVVMIGISLATPRSVPTATASVMARLHTPEAVLPDR